MENFKNIRMNTDYIACARRSIFYPLKYVAQCQVGT